VALACYPLAAAAAVERPPALELLERVRQAYAALTGYRDHGAVEVTSPAGLQGATRRYQFATAAGARGELV
jgi:hypothetical protein